MKWLQFPPLQSADACAENCLPCADCCDCDLDRETTTAQLRGWAWFLTFLTITWNAVEAIVGTISGILAHSVALVGYGLDSLVEVSSALIVTWRLSHHSADPEADERAEGLATRLIAVSLAAIAGYVAIEATLDLIGRDAPERSPLGIAIVALSLLVMPGLAAAKRRVASGIDSTALNADAAQTQVCFYLAGAVLIGLLANQLLGLWWMDPLAGFLVAALALREARAAWMTGELCADDCAGADARVRWEKAGNPVQCLPSGCPGCPTAA